MSSSRIHRPGSPSAPGPDVQTIAKPLPQRAAQPIVWPSVSGAAAAARPAPLSDAQTQDAAPPPPPPDPLQEPVVRQRLEQVQQEALRRGEQAGFEKASAQVQPVLDRMTCSLEHLASLRTRFRHEAEQQVVDLALAVAQKIIQREVHLDPDTILGVVKAALGKVSQREVTEIRVSPPHQAAIEQHLRRIGAPVAIRVTADPTLELGSVLVECTRGTLDASVETQLMEIRRGFADLIQRPSA